MTSLEVVTERTMVIKTLFKNLKNIVNEANIEFINDGSTYQYLKINVLDPAKVLMVNVRLYGNNFNKFVCTQNKITLGVDMNSFSNLLNSANSGDVFKLLMYQSNLKFCEIQLCHPTGNSSTFSIKPLDLPTNNIVIPAVTFTTVITIDSKKFYKLCTEMNKMADHVEIKCFPDKIIFTCKKNDMEMKSTFTSTDNYVNIKYSNNVDSPPFVSNIFEIKYLLLISKYSPLCNTVELFMKNDFPLTVKYDVGSFGRILMCLCPIEKGTDVENDLDLSIKSSINTHVGKFDIKTFDIKTFESTSLIKKEITDDIISFEICI